MSIRPDGQLFCDSMRSGRALNLSDPAYFKQASGSTEPAVELVIRQLGGAASLQVALPARNQHGELKYVLLASLNPAQYSAHYAGTTARHIACPGQPGYARGTDYGGQRVGSRFSGRAAAG